jgi:hypothetical protein
MYSKKLQNAMYCTAGALLPHPHNLLVPKPI